MTLGEEIKSFRKTWSISAVSFAKALGISPSYVTYLEKDKRSPGLELQGLIRRYLELGANKLPELRAIESMMAQCECKSKKLFFDEAIWMEYASSALAGFCSNNAGPEEPPAAAFMADKMLSEHKKRWSK